ncbi:MAG: restriction endonuclease subunit S [Microcystis aeruginosa DA14]|uniref:Restriction endonuclease subunit S n=1 Tax=Microcystis aeruginosa DA14 TaxID=1987506 RepID=A0A3E0MKB1_MICAE|nr:MAG: restriction endonuclease subunit S [Microcystis aeruginosa DA14]
MIMIYPSEITKKWPHRPLSEVVDFLDSKRKPITQKDRVPGPYPYYGANGQQDSVADYIFDEPLVLLAEDGGHFGDADKTIAYQVEGKCWVNNHAHVLRPKKDVDIRYICRHLERYDVTPFITGSTRGKLTKTAANNIPIALPPLEEQRRIAAILDKADGVRRKRKEAIRLTDELLKSTFLEMFGDPVTNPKGWEIVKIENIIELVSGQVDPRESPYSNMLHVGGDNIESGTGEISGCKTPAELSLISGKYLFRKGDILYSKIRPYLNKVSLPDFDGVCSADIYPIRVNHSCVTPIYMTSILRSKGFLEYAEKHSTRTNIPKINRKALLSFECPLPPLGLQNQFTNSANKILKIKDHEKTGVDKANNLFNSLLQRAFRGEL